MRPSSLELLEESNLGAFMMWHVFTTIQTSDRVRGRVRLHGQTEKYIIIRRGNSAWIIFEVLTAESPRTEQTQRQEADEKVGLMRVNIYMSDIMS